ncbi:Arc family DNA-binding protein [Klebsiella huaxiensis]|uniref:Arc-like DNA binding domain-containing protein n=1 Tax=Klebsiella huaxiensis TaxID=2153354 RepID=A0A564M4E0_9ENTR|nr:Arc family DNA-binding protein [Klebsiella huaxiensis]VUS88755.1 hypothetical protein SB6422_02763 [Klebsiella huaxiensis]
MSKYPSQMQDKFNLRFPDGMRDAIAERAKANGRSMNSEIVQILQDALDGVAEKKALEQLDLFKEAITELRLSVDASKKARQKMSSILDASEDEPT